MQETLRRDEVNELYKVLHLLAPDDASALRHHYLEGRSYDAIAARLGISKVKLKKRVQRAIREVRSMLGEP